MPPFGNRTGPTSHPLVFNLCSVCGRGLLLRACGRAKRSARLDGTRDQSATGVVALLTGSGGLSPHYDRPAKPARAE